MKKLIPILFLIFNLAFAQEASIRFNGKIVANGSKPVYNVSIVNKTQTTGTLSDQYGDFALKVAKGDLISFTCIGYKTIDYIVPVDLNEGDFRVLVNMVEDTVYIREAVVVPWPVNRTMLKEAMLEKRLEKESISPYAGFREIEGDPEPVKPTLMNPVSFLYSKLNKKARQEKKMEKYRQILQEDEFYKPQKEQVY